MEAIHERSTPERTEVYRLVFGKVVAAIGGLIGFAVAALLEDLDEEDD